MGATKWKEVPLSEVVSLQRGFDLPKQDRSAGQFPVVASTAVVDTHRKAMVQGPGVVIGRSGQIGGAQYIVDDFWPLNTTLWVKDFKGNHARFVYYLLKSLDFSGFNAGSSVPTLNRNHLANIPIKLPPLAEQRRIAHILGTLDDKIELNRRMNATLEAMARALFKSWFVDFDPVHAKAAGRPSGLPPEIEALFPDSFVDSELGQIPEGWEVKRIGEVVEVVGGGTPSTKNPEYWDNGTYAFATPKDLSSIESPVLLETEKRVTEAGLKRISSGLLPKGTLLLSSRAPVGYLAISAVPVCVNQGFIAMKCNELPNFFVLNWALENMASIQAVASGTTFPEVSKANFRPLQIVLPSTDLVAAYASYVKPLYKLIERNLKQNQVLSETRDRILPRLLQGLNDVLS